MSTEANNEKVSFESCKPDLLDGSFVESAFKIKQIDQAIAEEKKLGVQDSRCLFLGTDARV